MSFSNDNPIKGHVFDPADDASLPDYMKNGNRQARRLAVLTPAEKQTQAAALTERYAVVLECKECKEPLIAEEAIQHRLNHEHGTVRSMVGTVLQQPREHQERTLAVLTELLAPAKKGIRE